MRFPLVRAAIAAFALVTISCSGNDITGPNGSTSGSIPSAVRTDVVAAALPTVRISEIHYDNAGTDAGEAIEISMPVATDPTGYSIVLYNGAAGQGTAYDTDVLPATSTVCTTDATRKVVVVNYPSNGIQNGSPDGIALVGPGNALIEFLSYEGTFTGVGGAAGGVESTDIGAQELGTAAEPPGLSLKRSGADVWSGPSASSFTVCNDLEAPPAVVDHVIITPDGGTILEGNSLQLTATAYDAGDVAIPGTTFTWTSANEAIATVSATGLVAGIDAGNTTIIAAAPNGKADTVAIQVDEPPPPGTGDEFISELHYDNDGVDVNERVEIEGPAGGSLEGWSVVLYNLTNGQSYATIALSGTFPSSCDTRGVLVFNGPAGGIQNGPSDGLALVNSSGTVIEFISYEGTLTATNGPANGMTSTDIGVDEPASSSATRSLQRFEDAWYGPSPSSFGTCNGPPPPPTIFIIGRAADEPPLPVGFDDQLFATLTDASGNELDTAFVWSSDTPGIASIDSDGVVTALSPGTAILRATLKNSTITNTSSLTTAVATFSGVAYPGNAEFGEPADGNAADDFIVRHQTFTLSFSSVRNTPNWVSYNLDASHIGIQDRCNCFTYDPALPAAYTRYTTADYTGAGAFHGYGIDRGHLARSFDRTTGTLDNAYTFYFSNIIPQAADNNQGPWANMENFLGNLATAQNKEVYIIAGVAGNIGTIKNEGILVIPEFTWKVAVILPRDQGLASIDDLSDLEVIAVIMPNIPGIRNVDWNTYRKTVDQVEALSGYDILALLPDPIEIAVESQTVPPVAAVDGPYTALEFESIAMSAAASSDADAGQTLTYAWDFGDGTTGTGVSVSHAYSTGGNYNIRVIVSDPLGLADTVFTTAAIQTPAQGATDALALIAQLRADGKISNGIANSLSSKVNNAIKSLGKGNDSAAVDQLNAVLTQLTDLENTGVLSAADAAPLRALIQRIIASASQ